MSEMVERVARAMADREAVGGWENCSENPYAPSTNRARWRERAVNAIEAMREPTEAMIDAGVSQYEQEQGGISFERIRVVVEQDLWPAMIDEALK